MSRKHAALSCLRPLVGALDTSIAREPPKRADNFYTSPEWRSLMARIKRKRPDCCERCGRTNTRLFGDHITELKDGGAPLEENNVQLLCGSCHTAKTHQARAERYARQY